MQGDRLVAIREHADASAEERKVTLCNAGVMAFDGKTALKILDKIGNANSKGEYYLVDAVTIARDMGLEAVVIETNEDEVRGINTKAQLAEAEGVMQARLRKVAMEAGVTPIAPETSPPTPRSARMSPSSRSSSSVRAYRSAMAR
jgi:bifunctional UDP-N-acetylglucosamine pyrophosphorylase/glucosamine-1-phosphate N-acetyltransferase